MQASDLTVEVRDKDLVRVGAILPIDLDLILQDNFNNIGSWTLKLSPEHPMASHLMTPGSGLIVTAPSWTVSGPTIRPELSATVRDPNGNLTFTGVTDDIILQDRLCYPDPMTDDVTDQEGEDEITGYPADMMMHYVMINAGVNAVVSRQIANFEPDDDWPGGDVYTHGTEITKVARFQTLATMLTEISARRRDFGFRIVQRPNGLKFECFIVEDRSDVIRLDVHNNTLASHLAAINPPTVTRAIVAGSSESNRVLKEVSSAASLAAEAAWGRRIERLVDARSSTRPADIDDDLDAAGAEIISVDGDTFVSIQVTPTDDSSMVFGTDWNMGDKIAVVVDGTEYVETVSGMIVKASPAGFTVGALIGDPRAFDPVAGLAKLTKATTARVDKLEKVGTTTPFAGGSDGGGGGGGGGGSLAGITNPGGFLYATDPIIANAGVIVAGHFVTSAYPTYQLAAAETVPDGVFWHEGAIAATMTPISTTSIHIIGTCRVEFTGPGGVMYFDVSIEDLTTSTFYKGTGSPTYSYVSACSGPAGIQTIPISQYWNGLTLGHNYRIAAQFYYVGTDPSAAAIYDIKVFPTLG